MKAAVAVRDITPRVGCELVGFAGRKTASVSVADPLRLEALALEDDAGARAVLVCSDLLYYDRDHVAEIRREVQRRTGLAPERLLVNASHTHYGPATIPRAGSMMSLVAPGYILRLSLDMVSAVEEALGSLGPADVRLACTSSDAGVNRRRLTDKGWIMAPNPDGPYDNTVVVLDARMAGGRRAVMANYACHPTTRAQEPVISADFAGAMKRIVAETLGDGAVAMFLQGAGGDAKTRNVDPSGERFAVGTAEAVERLGRVLADDVLGALPSGRPIDGPIRAATEEVWLPVAEAPDRQTLETQAAGDDPYRRVSAQALLRRLDSGRDLAAPEPYEVQGIAVGDGLVVAAGEGEVCNGYARRARTDVWPDRTVAFAGYSNGWCGYVPTGEILAQGGYEPDMSRMHSNLPGRYAPEIEDIVVDAMSRVRDRLG